MRAVLPALSALLLVQIFVTGSSFVGPVLAPLVAAELGVDPTLVGLYAAAMYGAGACASLGGAGFIHRIGALRLNQISLCLTATGLLAAASGAVWALPASALLMGIALGPTTPASSHILARLCPPHMRNLVFSIKQTGVPVGGAASATLLPGLALSYGWRGVVVAIAVLCLGVAALIQPLRRRLDADRMPASGRLRLTAIAAPLRIVMTVPALRRMMVASVAYNGMQSVLTTFLVTYLNQGVGLDLVTSGLLLTAAQTSGAIGRIAWGGVADRIGNAAVLLASLGLVMAASAVLASAIAPGWPVEAMLVLFVVFGATAIGWNGVYLAEVAHRAPPGQAGAVTGASGTLGFGTMMAAPALFTVLLAATGSYAVAFCAIAAFTGAASLLLLRLARTRAANPAAASADD